MHPSSHHGGESTERFRSLHDAAAALLDAMETEYRVSRRAPAGLPRRIAELWPDAEASTLEPLGGGAPVTVATTPFPGVIITFGHNGRATFPRWGCSECDEDPNEEATRLADTVRDIAAGGLTEARRRRLLRIDFYDCRIARRDGSGEWRSSGPLGPDASPVPVGVTHWPSWRTVLQHRCRP